MKKKGQVLTENVVFIVLNLIFLTILILFVFSKSGSEAVLEEKYSKQIALMIDSAKPGMVIVLNMEDAVDAAEENNWDLNNIISITDNKVQVKLREKGDNFYYFFNNIEATVPEISLQHLKQNKEYIINIGDYK